VPAVRRLTSAGEDGAVLANFGHIPSVAVPNASIELGVACGGRGCLPGMLCRKCGC
jgi:NCAIR mutase (PurE)-related protein